MTITIPMIPTSGIGFLISMILAGTIYEHNESVAVVFLLLAIPLVLILVVSLLYWIATSGVIAFTLR